MMKPKGLYILALNNFADIYGATEQRDLEALVDFVAPPKSVEDIKADMGLLKDVEVIFSGWGGPCLDEAFLDAAPKLKAVFYGAGSAGGVVTDASWNRGVLVTTSYAANAVPVAEFTLAMIIFGLKRGVLHANAVRANKNYPPRLLVPGCYGTTVGLISIGMIAKIVVEMLKPFDMKVVAYDPFLKPEAAAAMGIELVALDEVFRRADAVSLHTPWLKETEGMITGAHFGMMKEGATFINTARGAVVNEPEMIEALVKRPDLQFILDVTYPEPPVSDSPLYTAPNVLLTPHIAGSMANECHRMGRYMVEEFQRFQKGEPLKYEVTRELAAISSHRPAGMKP